MSREKGNPLVVGHHLQANLKIKIKLVINSQAGKVGISRALVRRQNPLRGREETNHLRKKKARREEPDRPREIRVINKNPGRPQRRRVGRGSKARAAQAAPNPLPNPV